MPVEASPQQALADQYRGEEFSESSDNTKEYRKEYEALLRKENGTGGKREERQRRLKRLVSLSLSNLLQQV